MHLMELLTSDATNVGFIADTVSFFNFQAASTIERLAQNPYWSTLKMRFPWKFAKVFKILFNNFSTFAQSIFITTKNFFKCLRKSFKFGKTSKKIV